MPYGTGHALSQEGYVRKGYAVVRFRGGRAERIRAISGVGGGREYVQARSGETELYMTNQLPTVYDLPTGLNTSAHSTPTTWHSIRGVALRLAVEECITPSEYGRRF